MAKSKENSGSRWSSSEIQKLRKLAKGNTPTRVIGLKLGRTENAIQSKASQEGVSLKPTNQSPYGHKANARSKRSISMPPKSGALSYKKIVKAVKDKKSHK